MISACFYAQARIRKFTAKAACGPRSGQESPARLYTGTQRKKLCKMKNGVY